MDTGRMGEWEYGLWDRGIVGWQYNRIHTEYSNPHTKDHQLYTVQSNYQIAKLGTPRTVLSQVDWPRAYYSVHCTAQPIVREVSEAD